jgi:hypothetical protein
MTMRICNWSLAAQQIRICCTQPENQRRNVAKKASTKYLHAKLNDTYIPAPVQSVTNTRRIFYFITAYKWTQNNSKLRLRHSERGREDGKGKGQQDGKQSVWVSIRNWKHFPPLNFDTIGDILIHWLCTTQYFVNQRNYKTLAMQAYALTRTRYFTA